MGNRDDFSRKTLDELAKRVAYRCSAPSCRVPTVGPSESRKSGVAMLGVGAHITAAAPGGPRYDARFTAEERASIDNGIWLCSTHAKMIDDDEKRFTVAMLNGWKKNAERVAGREMGGAPGSLLPALLIDHDVTLTHGDFEQRLDEAVEAFFEDCGAHAAWGRQLGNATHLMTYELVLNAFRHGSADLVRLATKKGCLHVSYRGRRFGPEDLLRTEGRGGQAALKAFRRQCRGSLEVMYRADGASDGAAHVNEWVVVDFHRGLAHHHPCGVRLGRNFDVTERSPRLRGCEEIHVHLDRRRFFSYSHAAELAKQLIELLPERTYVFHGVDQNVELRAFIASRLPNARFFDARRGGGGPPGAGE
jgi:hypothetical protein